MAADFVFNVPVATGADKGIMWTHREKCKDCKWAGYRSDLKKRKPTAEENKKYGAANDPNVNKKYDCCPECGSFNVVGHEIEDDHLQGI